jgi:subtilase family serine protease
MPFPHSQFGTQVNETMRPQPARFRRILLFFAFFSLLFARPGFAQTAPTASRITQAVDEANLTVLKGNTYYLARAEFDRGAAPASLPMNRMLLILQRSPEQESALEQLLDQQQDHASPNYHQWLTPQQFGQQFGPSDQDVEKITSWLQSHGFQIAPLSNGRTVNEFSGTAGQVQEAFHTSIHKYSVPNATGTLEDHWANSTDPAIPAALAPVVLGINTLHNFPRKPMHVVSGVYKKNKATGETNPVNPEFTFTCGTNQSNQPVSCYSLGPYDFATIYNVLPLWNGSPAPVIDGTGQTIAIIGETDVDMKDIENFRSLFGLPANDPVVILDGPDPGVVPGDETESDLDLQWSGAIAKGATIKFVTSASTNTTLGVDLSAQYAVDHNVASVLSESYGICELGLGTAGNQFYNAVWQQAAAQGITAFVSAGDSGSAGCDSQDNPSPAPSEYGLQVNGFASTPYNVAVGGTDFNDLSNPATYWNTTNNATTQLSAKSYIPEVPWNDSCTSQALVFYGYPNNALENCNDQQLLGINVFTVGGAGGKSACTTNDGQHVSSCAGGYTKPLWQTGTGVPDDGKRDIPDVSLFASGGFYTNSFYIVCEADQTQGVYCDQDPQSLDFLGVGGTSASTPSFAGIMALVNQKTASRQGNANYILYKLAAQSGASCTSSGTPASTCIFYDITTGTNAMPCDDTGAAPVNCGAPGSAGIGILTGYNSTAGYDLTTGLGSVNAANLVNKWSTITSALKASAPTLSLNPTASIAHGSPVTVQINVTPTPPTTGTATGNVALLSTSAVDPGVTDFALTNGSVNSTTNVLPGGSYHVTAHYPGDGNFAASDSTPVSVTVTPESSKVAVSFFTQTSQGNILPFSSGPYGSTVYPRADVSGNSGNGVPTGTVTFLEGGNSITGIPALTLNSQGNVLPTNPTFTFTAGTHSITGAYSGDPSFNASTSPAASFTITQAVTTAGPPSVGSGTAIFGSAALISGTVSAQSCGNLPTGTITFFDGATQLGTPQTVQASTNSNCAIQATASVTTSAYTLGNNSITYKYNGDTNYAAAVSAAAQVDAQIGTSVALTSSAPTIQQGQSITFTATITPGKSGGPAMTGTVSFLGNSVTLGTIPLSNGQAQLATSALPSGNVQIVANYSGDTNYSAGSFTINQQVTPGPDFNISFAPSAVNVTSPGASASTALTVIGSNSYNGTITFTPTSCTTGLPFESSCSFSPASVTGSGSTTLTVSTMAPSSLIPLSRHVDFGGWRTTAGALRLLLLCAALFALGIQARRHRWNLIGAALVFALLIANAACGGGGGSTGPTNPGTPMVQNQKVTVSATSGAITHTFTFTLNVN